MLVGSLSNPAVVIEPDNRMLLQFQNDGPFGFVRMDFSAHPLENDLRYNYVWGFSSNYLVGHLIIEYDGYLFDDEDDVWEMTGEWPKSLFTYDATGDYSDIVIDGPNMEIHLLSAFWDDLPPDEQNP